MGILIPGGPRGPGYLGPMGGKPGPPGPTFEETFQVFGQEYRTSLKKHNFIIVSPLEVALAFLVIDLVVMGEGENSGEIKKIIFTDYLGKFDFPQGTF